MNEILQANIFFVIASVATVIFLILVSIALFQVIKILIAVRTVTERIASGSTQLADNVADIRDFVAGGGLLAYIMSFVTKRKSKSRSTKTKTARDDN